MPSLSLSSGQTVHGVRTVASYLSAISRQTLLGNSALERAQVDQWLEYWQLQLETYVNDTTQVSRALTVRICHTSLAFILSKDLGEGGILVFFSLYCSE